MAPSKQIPGRDRAPMTMAFPSELREMLISKRPKANRHGDGSSIQPPRAYTEFLKALSPVFPNADGVDEVFPRCSFTETPCLPTPLSSRASSTSSAVGDSPGNTIQSDPLLSLCSTSQSVGTLPLRHLGIPPPYTPATDFPWSPYTIRSASTPSEWKIRYFESPKRPNDRNMGRQYIVTHTITIRRVPSIDPPSRGKRRRTNKSEE